VLLGSTVIVDPVNRTVVPVSLVYQFISETVALTLSVCGVPRHASEFSALIIRGITRRVLAEILSSGSPGVPPYSTTYPLA
jgi:hypothetical protein